MEVYRVKDGFVMGVKGGKFYNLSSEPEAIILKNRPVPTKMWSMNTFKDTAIHKGQEWYVDIECKGYSCDNNGVYIMQFKYYRYEPGYCRGFAEFFISEDYLREKLSSFKKIRNVTEYAWDIDSKEWKEVTYIKYFRKA